jgi:1,2-diacylglycerol 3-beta-glucosyltransferase
VTVSRLLAPLRAGLTVAAGAELAAAGYLLTLLEAARRARPLPLTAARGVTHFVVLVPAHDEERVIGASVSALSALDYPGDRYEVIVIADNCRDRTAEEAERAGATVWVRGAPDRRGKGQALAWAFARTARERPGTEAVVVVDADCRASPNLLGAVEARLLDGAAVAQTDYVVDNPEESTSSALRFAAFALVNTVRPLGKERLRLSAGLLGTGMAFSAAVLERHPWGAFSVVEDREQHLRLVLGGERVAFVPEARVSSPMPVTASGSRTQRLRWEGGGLALARGWSLRLLRAGLRRRDPVRVHAAFELLVPTQSALALSAGGTLLAGLALRRRAASAAAASALAGQAAFVLGGLRLVDAPRGVYRSLGRSPALVASKIGLYRDLARGEGTGEWVRTERR